MPTKQVPFTLVVQEVPTPPDYFPAINPPNQTVYQGGVATYTVSVAGAGGFADPVLLAVTGLPEGFLALFDVNPVLPGQFATLTIATTNLPVGSYNLTLEATA